MKKDKTIGIDGMHCAACSARVEKALSQLSGVASVNVNLALEEASLSYDDRLLSDKKIEETIRKLGFSVREQIVISEDKHILAMKRAGNRMMIAWLITIVLTVIMIPHMLLERMIFSHQVDSWIMFLLSLTVMTIPGSQVYVSAYKSIRSGSANMDVLISIGTIASVLTLPLSYLVKGIPAHAFSGIAAMILAFHLTGRYLEAKAKGKASEAIRKLMNLGAKTALVMVDGQEKEVPILKLKEGDIFIVKPGMKIATDGEIIEGISSLDESMATGESIPVTRKTGDRVIGATLNLDGALKVKASKVGSETFLAQVMKLVQEAQHSKVPIQVLADKVTAVFVPLVLLLTLFTFLAWILFPDFMNGISLIFKTFVPLSSDSSGIAAALMAAIATLVIACPCALGLATPTALMVGSGIGAQNGILIRNGESLQLMKDIRCMVFDKTGTLTQGKPELLGYQSLAGPEEMVLRLAASLEAKSEHPLGLAITRAARDEGLGFLPVDEFHAITGQGITGYINGKYYQIGNRELLKAKGLQPPVPSEGSNTRSSSYATEVFLAGEKDVIAIFRIADQLKPEARMVVAELKKQKIESVMLSGDTEEVAAEIARQCGIGHFKAGILPGDKANEIKRLQSEFGRVAMIGDGINDAPALKMADIGIAMGKGTDIAMEAADITIVRSDLSSLLVAITLSNNTFRKIKQNLFWAFFYNLIAIPLAVFGALHPIIAEMAMATSSVTVVSNANLLRRKKLR